jgi:hypothetical protein
MKLSGYELAVADRAARQEIAEEELDTMPTEGWYNLTPNEKARSVVEQLCGRSRAQDAREVEELGEVLVTSAVTSAMGNAGNSQYWVIQPDGTERNPDEVEYRRVQSRRGTRSGDWSARMSWHSCSSPRRRESRVRRQRPGGGCTRSRSERSRLESEAGARFEGAVGGLRQDQPGVGNGWGLHSSRPEPAPAGDEKADLSKVDLQSFEACPVSEPGNARQRVVLSPGSLLRKLFSRANKVFVRSLRPRM